MNRVCCVVLGALLCVACGDDDGGNDNDNQNQITAPVCGDGQLDPGELCDDGESNSDSVPDACRSDCRDPHCGDNVTDTGEECDEGGANSDLIANACRRDCRLAHCGDGVLDLDEACDDGNGVAGDGCSSACEVEDGWRCAGMPSACECDTFRTGAGCQKCVIFADVDSGADPPDGTSWATAFASLQAAVDAAEDAGDSCEVWVASGTYSVFLDSPENSLRLRSGVGIYGGFVGDETSRSDRDATRNKTVITGFGAAPFTNVYHVVTAVQTQDATLDGFRITGGCANGDSIHAFGGLILSVESRLAVQDCIFTSNLGEAPCTQNAAVYNYQSDSTFRRCIFAGNIGWYETGGMLNIDSEPLIDDCLFSGNIAVERGCGAINNRQSSPIIHRTIFSGNWAGQQGGAICNDESSPVIVSSVFAGNVSGHAGSGALRGGAMENHDSTPTITNCTFFQNHADAGLGDDIYNSSSGAVITNTIFWGSMDGFFLDTNAGGPDPTITYSVMQGLAPTPPTTNTNADPNFASPGLSVGTVTGEDVPDFLGGWKMVLTVTETYTPGALVGLYIQPDVSFPHIYYIVGNTANTITVWGSVYNSDAYMLYTLRPAPTSSAIDTGDDGAPQRLPGDVTGTPWDDDATHGTAGTVTDIGAYEYDPAP